MSASWGESRPILVQELQGHTIGPTETKLQGNRVQNSRAWGMFLCFFIFILLSIRESSKNMVINMTKKNMKQLIYADEK